MLTLGTWLAPIIALVMVVASIPAGLWWRSRRRVAIRRIAERLADMDSWERDTQMSTRSIWSIIWGGKHWQGQDGSEGRTGARRTVWQWREVRAA